uniref:TFIIS-type domain-containing protein n=1 Tax=Oncorhynchus tshawytscha TaxID=74940 RepID=A0A8C8GB92_ONCTS
MIGTTFSAFKQHFIVLNHYRINTKCLCKFKPPINPLFFLCVYFSGQEVKSIVVFNSLELSTVAVEVEDSELSTVIERRSSRCNKEGMVYHTRQMRSADEGQAVFYRDS